jgi:hypothetical protein
MKSVWLLALLILTGGCSGATTAPEQPATLQRAVQGTGEWTGIYHRIGGLNVKMRLSLHGSRSWIALDNQRLPMWGLSEAPGQVEFYALVENEPVRFVGTRVARIYYGQSWRSGDIQLAVWEVERRAHEEVTIVHPQQ